MKSETKVGLLFVSTLALVAVFAYYLGAINPFSSSHSINLMYNFAGGIEPGSAVRVMGVKVGKVESIDFIPNQKDKNGDEVKLRIKISIQKKAWNTLTDESRFYINLAGVIGEKYIEVTPGSAGGKKIEPGASLRGVDPPRIDQLLSQGYSLAGKILDLVESNEKTFVGTLENLNTLAANLNKTMVLLEKMSNRKDIGGLLANTNLLVKDLVVITSKLKGKDAEKAFAIIQKLLSRVEGIDEPTLRKFLQDEGIRARIF